VHARQKLKDEIIEHIEKRGKSGNTCEGGSFIQPTLQKQAYRKINRHNRNKHTRCPVEVEHAYACGKSRTKNPAKMEKREV